MQKPSLGWQSWSPPFPKWHGFPRWDYPPFKVRAFKTALRPACAGGETPKRLTKINYWCSWYAYGWNINHQKIVETLTIIKKYKLPLTHIIIDDGWATWGDWYTPNSGRFPNLTETVEAIHANHLEAGLWLAPFLASNKSQLFKNHPNWFVKYHGHYVQGLKTMPIWESCIPKRYLLNFELPEVKKYITDFIDLSINKWGITLLKLDFLYAPYFNPHHKSDSIPHNHITWLLNYIKNHYPQVTTIACGTPFAATIGLADIVRISKDTALPPEFPKILNKIIYTFRVHMLRHKISAASMHQNFTQDPDVRLFALDTTSTNVIWNTVSKNILGVGDNLNRLQSSQIIKIKSWLSSEATNP